MNMVQQKKKGTLKPLIRGEALNRDYTVIIIFSTQFFDQDCILLYDKNCFYFEARPAYATNLVLIKERVYIAHRNLWA